MPSYKRNWKTPSRSRWGPKKYYKRPDTTIQRNSFGSTGLTGKNPSDLNRIYRFRQCCSRGQITSATSGIETEANLYFTLNDLPQVATFTALFDQYKFEKVEITLWPRANMNPSGASNATTQGTLITAIDLDNITSLSANPDALRQFGTCIETMGYERQWRVFKPNIALATYAGAFTSFANASQQWIDSASPTVQHYGFRIMLANTGSANDMTFDVRCVYHLAFRNVN